MDQCYYTVCTFTLDWKAHYHKQSNKIVIYKMNKSKVSLPAGNNNNVKCASNL